MKIIKISGLFAIDPKILGEIRTYVNSVFRDFNLNSRERVSKKLYPPKTFMLDFSGTRWDFLQPMEVLITFSSDDKSLCYSNRRPIHMKEDEEERVRYHPTAFSRWLSRSRFVKLLTSNPSGILKGVVQIKSKAWKFPLKS